MRSRIKRVVAVGLSVCFLSLAAAAWAETTQTEGADVKQTTQVEKVKGGEIDWGKEMFYATGDGAVPPASQEPNRAKAYLKAKGYARMQATANLLMVIEGTTISYEGFGRDYMAENETLRQRIEGYVKGVEILDEDTVTVEGDKMVRVTVGTKMYGKANPGTAFVQTLAKTAALPPEEQPKSAPVSVEIPKQEEPTAPVETPVAQPASPPQVGPFTSLVLDTRGFKVSRSMSPKIRWADGSEVWGTVHADADFVIETGIVAFANTMEAALSNQRCGSNPLKVKAIGRAGGKAMCDAVITDEDATRILAENSQDKFLDKFRVIMIVDPLKLFPK